MSIRSSHIGAVFISWLCMVHLASANHGPVAHWTFDLGLTDPAGHEIQALGCDQEVPSRVGNAQVPGVLGRAVAIGTVDSNLEYLTVDMTRDLKPNAVYTLEAWIVPTHTNGWRRLILLWGNAPDYAYHFALHNGMVSLAHGQTDG
ncbi:MAG: hypothetical protein HQ515_07175, partial [Phycisphaeraceae bacterium]|nr:hypothetical protein [Phycisphaeraceae bacterium]